MTALPVLVTALLGTATGVGLLYQRTERVHLCRILGLQLQKQRAKLLNDLLNLNPKADRLRKQYMRTQNAIKAARATGNFTAMAGLTAMLAYLQLQRKKLNSEQQFLLKQAQALIPKWKAEAQKHLPSTISQISETKLSVIAVPPHGLAPHYSPAPQTERLQLASTRGKLDLFDLNWSCGTTLRQKGSLWEAALAPAI